MTRLRRTVFVVAILCLLLALALWWTRPRSVDMAMFAPADSLVYVEANSLTDLASGISKTNAWGAIAPILGTRNSVWTNSWLLRIARWTGLGPIDTVIISRAQVAVVMENLGTAEEGEVLRVKPELAVLIETHTSRFRIESVLEKRVQTLAQGAYGQTSFRKEVVNGQEFLIWTAALGSRQIIASIDGSLIIVGNSEAIVAKCLSVRHGEQPSLAKDSGLQTFRQRMRNDNPLAFGYVSAANSARLAAVATPLFLGRNNNDLGFEKLLVNAADKILGAVAWGAFANNGLIEDRYLINLQHPVGERLQASFAATLADDPPHQFLPARPYSLTYYKYRDPLAAWEGLESAGLARLDAVSAALFKGLLDAALVPYGIKDPSAFLKTVGPPLVTVRMQGAERTAVLATVVNEAELRPLILERLGPDGKHVSVNGVDVLQTSDDEWCAAFIGNHLLMGDPDAVRSCLQGPGNDIGKVLQNPFGMSASSPVVTYTDDSDRVRSFFSAFAKANNNHPSTATLDQMDQAIGRLPYAVTETTLDSDGLIRRTRSPLGQFSTFVAYLFPEKPDR